MKKITLLFFVFFAMLVNAQTGLVVVGANNGTISEFDYPAPLQDYSNNSRQQFLYTAAELAGSGLVAGNITQIGWNVVAVGTSGLEEGYTISIKPTTLTALSTTFETGVTVVYGPTDFTPSATGNVMFTLTTPYNWDGTSNLIIEICEGATSGTFTTNVQTVYSTLSFNATNYYRSDNIAACPMATGEVLTTRPQLIVNGVLASCVAPTDFISSSITATGATVSWTASSSVPAQGYEYYYSATNTAPTASTTPSGSVAAGVVTANLTGLNPATTYYVWVRSKCSASDTSAWSGSSATFTTACVAVTSFSEGFDTSLDFPSCWRKVGTFGFAGVQADTESPSVPNNLSMISYDTTEQAVVSMPPVSNAGAGTHRLKFKARANSSFEIGGIVEVGYLTNPTDDTSFVGVAQFATTSSTVYDNFVVDLGTDPGTNQTLAFRHKGNPANAVLIDDVVWEPIPTCEDPTALVASSITTTGATVSWTASVSNPAQGYEYYYATSSTAPTASTAPSGSVGAGVVTVNLTGLTPATKYYVWMRSKCSASDMSSWSYSNTSFVTLCVPIASFSEGFESATNGALPTCWSKILRGPSLSDDAFVASLSTEDIETINGTVSVGLYTSNSDTSANDIMLVSPALSSLSSGLYRLKFNAKTFMFFGSGTGSIQIGTLDNNTNTAVFTPLSTVNITSQAAQYIVDFSSYTGTNQYIAFRMNDNNIYKRIILDNIVWELLPLCPDVTGITANNITTTSANITWTAGGNETAWNVAIAPSIEINPNNGTIVTTSSTIASVTSLTPNTIYKVWVRTVCAGGENGYWIGPITFTTPCNPVNVPYLQDFESIEAPALPSCSVIQNAGTGNNWETSVPFQGSSIGFTSNALTYTVNFNNPANAWYFTQGINLTAGTAYEISYKYGNNSTWFSEKLQVKYGMSPNQAGMTSLLADHPQINTATAQTHSVSFTPSTTGAYYFGFNAYSDAGQRFLYVDDILVDTSLSNDTFTNSTLHYYPNPVKDWFTLSYNKTIDFVKVYNLLGQEVLYEKINSNQASIQFDSLTKGSYIVKVFSQDKTSCIKVIKE